MIREQKGLNIISDCPSYVVIDIETTGLDFDFCSIIEISALKIENSSIIDRYTSLVHLPNGEHLDEFITQLTGITDEMLLNAPSIEKVIPEFYSFVADSILIGHNVNFDINFLYDACMFVLHKPLVNNYMDTRRFSRKLFPSQPHHRLIDLSAYCNVDYTAAHRAESDCLITFACFEKMKCLIKERYSSFSQFQELFKPKKYIIDVKSFVPVNDCMNEDHPFYKKTVVFTGALSNYTRKEAMQMVVNVGGLVANSVTKSTNYLVIGSVGFNKSVKEGQSSKMKKAEKMKLEDFDIEIISENAFFDVLNNG